MPINLKYGQKAVERGFISPNRLQQVLAKQRELGEQGKKVSVRMILEKAKLLNAAQLAQVDADLNIKVVKKQTGRIAAVPPPAPITPAGAQNFAGDAVPEFGGMSGQGVDVTVFEPPPADMQDRIRAERDKAKQQAKAKQEADAANFFAQNDASPFGGDPFGGAGEMAPEPMGEMQPEMTPEVHGDPFAGEMQPEPMQPAGMDDGGLAPVADEGMAELDRMDSSPKLTSLQAEFSGFASPDEEELPSLDAGFEQEPTPPARRGPSSGRAFLPPPPPPHTDLAPAAAEFESFGNDIMSPEALEAGAGTRPLGSAPPVERTMFSPPPPGVAPREKTGAMDRTMFSPRPAGFGAPKEAEPAPAAQNWDESPAMDAAIDDPSAATVFSPPPPEMQRPPAAPPKKPVGRVGAADFGNIELPVGKRMDDVPTAPATGEDVHPLRRSLTSHQSSSGQFRPPSGQAPALGDIESDLPMDEPSDMLKLPEKPVERGAKASGRGPKAEPVAASAGRDKFQPPMKPRHESRAAQQPAPVKRKKEKKETPRVWLFLMLFVIVLLAFLIVPIELQDKSKEMYEVRDFYFTRPLYDEVEKVYDMAKEQLGLPVPVRKKKAQQQDQPVDAPPPANTPDSNAPVGDPGSNAPPG